MSTIVTLVVTYFTRTPGLRWFSLLGLSGFALIAIGPWLPRPSWADPDVVGRIADTTASLSACVFFVGAALMPHMVGRLVSSHAIHVLPYGRLKLFLSALITTILVSVPVPTLYLVATLAQTTWHTISQYTFWENVKILSALFGDVYPTTFLVVSWLYLAIYFITSDRSLGGLAKALLVVIALIYVPTQRIVRLDPMFPWTSFEVAITWIAFGAWLFLAPQLKRARARRVSASPRSGRYAPGREFELMLGTSRPWLLAVAMLFPIVIQTLVGFQLPETWLFYLTLFSAVAGGLTGRAAERSRAIWLRARWSREQLFAHVEAAFWKHNSLALIALLVLLVAVVRVYHLPSRVIPLGVPLLVIGMVVSMYVGLIMTRGLQWIESTIAVLVMLSLMGVAVLAARETTDVQTVAVVEALFAVLAIVLRFVARARWHRIDWMLCRPDRSESVRAGA